MPHLSEEEVLQAARADRGTPTHAGGLSDEQRSHLDTCTPCATQVSGMRNLTSALRATEPDVRPPSFDALVAPALATERTAPTEEPAPAVAPLAVGASFRLAVALTVRQIRLVPVSLWPLAAVVLVALFVFAARTPDPAIASALFGPGATLLTTGAALAVCSPERDPRSEMLHTMPVPPAAVWLARLALVTGTVLAASVAVSAASAAVWGAPQSTGALIATWLGPAVLGIGMTVFGTVWRSPAVGAAFGAGSWLMSVFGAQNAVPLSTLPSGVRDTIGVLWSTTPLSLSASAVLLAAATWLVSRPERSLRES